MVPFNHKIGVCFLVDSVGKKSATQMAAECIDLGLQARPFVDVPVDLGIRIDKGYHFTAPVPGTDVCLLEILEHEDDVLQAKLMIVCKKRLFMAASFAGAEILFNDCKGILDLAFGGGSVADRPDMGVHRLYANTVQQAYVTLTRTGKTPVINVVIGNRSYWG